MWYRHVGAHLASLPTRRPALVVVLEVEVYTTSLCKKPLLLLQCTVEHYSAGRTALCYHKSAGPLGSTGGGRRDCYRQSLFVVVCNCSITYRWGQSTIISVSGSIHSHAAEQTYRRYKQLPVRVHVFVIPIGVQPVRFTLSPVFCASLRTNARRSKPKPRGHRRRQGEHAITR